MSGLLPVVSREVGVRSCAELIVQVIEDAKANPLWDEIERMNQENPEIGQLVGWMADDQNELIRMLLGAAVAYRALRAQAEVNALEELAGRNG